MVTVLSYAGAVLFGVLFGLSAAVFFAAGFIARGRAERGERVFGTRSSAGDPLVNTDGKFVEEVEQDRIQKGLETYINTEEA